MIQNLEIGAIAPDFSLIGADGMIYRLSQFRGSRAICLFFTCNHCPYVKASIDSLKQLYTKFHPRGVSFIGINSNSEKVYEEDSYQNMVEVASQLALPWHYLHDATQSVAKQFGAICTPHFFLLNQSRTLIYKGRSLDNPREPSKSQRDDLKIALEELLDSKPITTPLTEPVGCSIKWDPNTEKSKNDACAVS